MIGLNNDTSNNETLVGDEILINMTISQTFAQLLSYRVNLYANGVLSTTVGPAHATICWEESAIRIRNFTPILTKYTYFTDSEMKEIETHISKINMPIARDEFFFGTVWVISITYDGQTWYDGFRSLMYYSEIDENMLQIVNILIEKSPIEIVAYSLHDRNEIEYFNSLQFLNSL